jgi:hypothetical protein
MITLFKILVGLIILGVMYPLLRNISKPIWIKFKAKQRVRIAEAELEIAKCEAQATELEIQAQDKITQSINKLVER